MLLLLGKKKKRFLEELDENICFTRTSVSSESSLVLTLVDHHFLNPNSQRYNFMSFCLLIFLMKEIGKINACGITKRRVQAIVEKKGN